MNDLNSWKTTVATGVVSRLPLQTFDTAFVLAESYLASVGGWIPDDPTRPVGEGVPADGSSVGDASDNIRDNQIARMHRLNGTVTIELPIRYVANLNPDQDATSVINQLRPLVEDFINAQLGKTPLSLVSLGDITADIIRSGLTTVDERVVINRSVQDGTELDDPLVVAVSNVRQTFALDDEWNAESVYAETGLMMVTTRKYSDTTFATLDLEDPRQYVLGVNPATLTVVSGVQSPIASE